MALAKTQGQENVQYDILHTIVPGLKHPLADKLFDMFGVNHGFKWLWPLVTMVCGLIPTPWVMTHVLGFPILTPPHE